MAESQQTIAPAAELITKPGTKAPVWEYFGLEKDKNRTVIDDGRVVCRARRRKVLARNGNTSNLSSHLRANHAKLSAQLKDNTSRGQQKTAITSRSSNHQPTLSESIDKSQEYDTKGKRWIELTNAVIFYIAKDGQPMYTVEKVGFKKLLKAFKKRYTLTSRKYFSETALPNLYASLKEKVKLEISNITFYSATTDLWSSIELRPYISFTIHFINSEWELSSRCLQTQFIPDDHTGDNIAESLMSTLDFWNLDVSNQVCMTTDSATNVIKAARDLGWLRLSCFGHNLHLSIIKALAGDTRCSHALGVSRKIVSSFSMSWKRKREFSKAQINLGLKQHSLIAVSYLNFNDTMFSLL